MVLSKSKISLFSSLSTTKMRKRHGLFIVEGLKAVTDTVAAFQLKALVSLPGAADSIDVDPGLRFEVTPDIMKKISSLSTPSAVLAVFRMPKLALFEQKISSLDRNRLYLVLDGVQDPGNLGTIIRTCHWFGIYDIFASVDTVDIFNPKCIQSTMGSISSVSVHYGDLGLLFEKNRDMPVYGTVLDGDDIFTSELSDRGFIVMGNEGNGISTEIKSYITKPLLIPPATDNHGESLNVAIATAVTLTCFSRK